MKGNRFVRVALAIVAALVFTASAGAAPEILVLSNRADLISRRRCTGRDQMAGGDQHEPGASRPQRRQRQIRFATRNGHYTGLVTGLKNGDNVLRASAQGPQRRSPSPTIR